MKSTFFALLLGSSVLTGNNRALSQNIVPNPTFEEINTCVEYKAICSPAAWFNVNRQASRGYNGFWHRPGEGPVINTRFIAMIAATLNGNYRTYWQTRLLCPLRAGEKYRVTMKIAASRIGPNLRDIGFWFTDRFIYNWGDTLLQKPEALTFMDAKTGHSKDYWFEIKKEFTATRDASVLILGNFSEESNNRIVKNRKGIDRAVDIYVDELSIIPEITRDCPDYQRIKDSLYSIHNRHWDYEGSTHRPNRSDSLLNRPPASDPTGLQSADSAASPPAEPARPALPAAEKQHLIDTLRIDNISFEFDRYQVANPDILEQYRKVFTRPGIKKIRVAGYTDDMGTAAYNKELSEKRAREIARLLSLKFGIPAALIDAEGHGISKDFTDDRLNRRVEIYISH